MLSINYCQKEIVINKSRFIATLYHVENKDQVVNCLNEIKSVFKDASHYCYAYIIDNNIYCSDDSEPTNTAGKPILNVLIKNNLNHVLCIVTRYFGGIKLGVGGLTRAYTKAVTSVLNNSDIIETEPGYLVRLTTTFDCIKKIDSILKGIDIKKDFNDVITYTFDISINKYNCLIDQLNVLSVVSIIEKKEVIK